MYPRINKEEQQQIPKDENIKEEVQAEEQASVQPMGNSAANDAFDPNMLKEANGMAGEEFLAGLAEIAEDKKEGEGVHAEAGGIKEKLDDSISSVDEEDDPNIIDTRSEEQKRKDREARRKARAAAQNANPQPQAPANNGNPQAQPPVQDIYPDQLPLRPLTYVDPELSPQERFENQLLEMANEEIPDDAQTTKAIKPKKKKHKSKSRAHAAPVHNDIEQVNEEMQPAAGWNFTAQKLPERKKTGWFRRFLSGTAKFAGKTIGKTFNFLGNLVKLTYFKPRYWRSRNSDPENPRIVQESKRHDVIPGWNGQRFRRGPDGKDDILADFRRVPTVWSSLTAAKAEDEHGNPLPPKVSVNVLQPKEGVDKTMGQVNSGHTGIGIEYSRYSQVSNRYERYALRYGFYSGSSISAGSMANTTTALVPGKLLDERDYPFSITRTFPATTKQVNDILLASESWADKGYNALTRNCTTFVKTMVQDIAHIPAGESIFQAEIPRLSSTANFGMFMMSAHSDNARMGTEAYLEETSKQSDLSYAGWGNMRATKQDFRQYKETKGTKFDTSSKGFNPNGAAENMRRLEGEGSGTLSAEHYMGSIPKDRDGEYTFSFQNIMNAINTEGESLQQTIAKVAGQRDLNALFAMPDLPPELMGYIAELANMGFAMGLTDHEITDPDALRQSRAQLEEYISHLNTLLFRYFKNDKRLNIPVIHMISLLKRGQRYIDLHYRSLDPEENRNKDLGSIRGIMDQDQTISSGGVQASMSPSHYESYIQIYKDPETAIQKYSRLEELRDIKDARERKLTKAEKAELSKLERLDDLADDFDKSHRYMTDKGSYNQQDLDYAFALSKKEEDAKIRGSMKKNTAGNIYQSLFLEKIFSGMKQRFKNHFHSKEEAQNEALVRPWLENDLHECIVRKKDEMTGIVRAMSRANKKLNSKDLEDEIFGMVVDNWLSRVFVKDKNDEVLDSARTSIISAFAGLAGDEKSPYIIMIKDIIQNVQAENEL